MLKKTRSNGGRTQKALSKFAYLIGLKVALKELRNVINSFEMFHKLYGRSDFQLSFAKYSILKL